SSTSSTDSGTGSDSTTTTTGTGTGGSSGSDNGSIDFTNPDDPAPLPPVNAPVDPIDFSGTVFNDRDGDGVRDRGEPGIAGRTIYADDNASGGLDAGEVSAVTDSAGHYTLSLPPGDYTLRQIVPAHWYATDAAAGRHVTVFSGGVNGSTTFGAAKYGTISGSVFRDADHDGVRDAGE